MPLRVGRVHHKLQDPKAAQELDRIYDVLQNLKVDEASADIPKLARAIGRQMIDGDAYALNRFLEGKRFGRVLWLDSDAKDQYTLYLIKPEFGGPGPHFATLFVSVDEAQTEAARFENQKVGPAAYFRRVLSGGLAGSTSEAVVCIENPGGADGIIEVNTLARLSAAGQWVPGCSLRFKKDRQKPKESWFWAALKRLRIWRWRHRKTGDPGFGPCLEDFKKSFGVDMSDYALASVAVAGVQFLQERVCALEAKIEKLEKRL